MSNFDSVAIYAAGIADALAFMQSDGEENVARFEIVTEEYGGHFGIMQQVVEAAEVMERFRMKYGTNAIWGGELPYLYDVWDAIAKALWTRLGLEPIDQLVELVLEAMTNAKGDRQ